MASLELFSLLMRNSISGASSWEPSLCCLWYYFKHIIEGFFVWLGVGFVVWWCFVGFFYYIIIGTLYEASLPNFWLVDKPMNSASKLMKVGWVVKHWFSRLFLMFVESWCVLFMVTLTWIDLSVSLYQVCVGFVVFFFFFLCMRVMVLLSSNKDGEKCFQPCKNTVYSHSLSRESVEF